MMPLSVFLSRVRAMFSTSSLDRRLSEEMEFHLEMLVEEKVRVGMTLREARYAALREFGGIEQVKETHREARGIAFVESLLQDMRYALRMMRRQPVLTAVIGLTLALGIGAGVTVYSLLYTLFMRPLPYPETGRLVVIGEYETQNNRPAWVGPVRLKNFEEWRAQSRSFESMGAMWRTAFTVGGGLEPERVRAALVTADFFGVLGMKPLLGRTIAKEDCALDAPRVAVISWRLWQSRYGRRRDVVGQAIRLDGAPATIVGVMPARFQASLPEAGTRIWAAAGAGRPAEGYWVMGRLKSGVALESAAAEISAIEKSLDDAETAEHKGWGARMESMQANYEQGGSAPVAKLLFAAVGILLLISCVSVANLLLVRGVERMKEVALRLAMGAKRMRVLRQLMLENVLYALLGCGFGVVMAYWMNAALSRFGAPLFEEAGITSFVIDGRVLGYALLTSLVTAVVFGMLPAIRTSGVDLHGTLKEGGALGSTSQPRQRLSGALVVAELALSLMLLISAAFVLKSIRQLWAMEWGFPTSGRLTMNVALTGPTYADPAKRVAFVNEVLSRARGLAGVNFAAVTSRIPLELASESTRVKVEGQDSPVMAARRVVSADYWRALSIPMRKGRIFSEEDRAPVAVISESMARKTWGGADPIGKTLVLDGVARTVVGVSADVVNQGLLQKPGNEVCVPYVQDPPAEVALLIATSLPDPQALATPVRKEIARLDPDQPVTSVRTLSAVQGELTRPLEFLLLLLSVFAATAMFLAVLGVYGLTSHAVKVRTREIGIRMALGAGRSGVVRQVLQRGVRLTAIGLILGAAGSFVTIRLLLSKVWWVRPSGAHVVAAIALFLGAVAMVACYVPARRAAGIDPSAALRAE